MANKCEHIELTTDDPNAASDFYSQLFGWKIAGAPMPDGAGEYLMFQTDNGGGGIAGKMSPQQPTAWMPYITVPSIESTLASASRIGGQVVMPHTPVGDMGAIAVLRDPTGGTFGLWESAGRPPEAANGSSNKAKRAPSKPASSKKAAGKPAAKPAAKAKAPAKGAKGGGKAKKGKR